MADPTPAPQAATSDYREYAGATGSSGAGAAPSSAEDSAAALYRLTKAQLGLSIGWNRYTTSGAPVPYLAAEYATGSTPPRGDIAHGFSTGGYDLDVVPHGRQFTSNELDSKNMLDAVKYFYGINPGARAMIQAALLNRGFIKTKGWRNFEDPDETSGQAWTKALMQAAKQNLTIWEVLGGKGVSQDDFFAKGGDQLKLAFTSISNGGGGGGGGGMRRAPLQVRYSNPAELKNVAKITAQNTLGYVPDDQFLNDFVKLYHGLEAKPQKAAYAGAGSVTDPPSAQVAAQDELRSEFATESTGFSVAKQFGNMLKIMGVDG